MYKRNSHCSFCGTTYDENQVWPRTCATCQKTTYLNPLPVAVVLAPIDAGLLMVRRGVEPKKGKLALPGGFIGLGESWQEAGVREVFEETGLQLEATEIQDFKVLSAPDGTVLIFGLAQPRASQNLLPFQTSDESPEILIVNSTPDNMAFDLHEQVVKKFFSGS